jgi:DNA-binding beta-propeller fold protein YncE
MTGKKILFLSILLILALSAFRWLQSQEGTSSFQIQTGSQEYLESLMKVQNSLVYPTRIATGINDGLFVSDFKVGSVFVLDGAYNPVKELKDLDGPLGVAVDDYGRIYVGNMGIGNVEVYNYLGYFLHYLGDESGEFLMPSDIAVGPNDRIYVADSREHCVKVYDQSGQRVLVIGGEGSGEGQFKFPSTVAISHGTWELYVGDQTNCRVQVFDLDGNILRAFGSPVDPPDFEGEFGCIQSIAVEEDGGTIRIHVVDTSQNRIQVLTETGDFLSIYGETGLGMGQLNLPLDAVVTFSGQTIVCNAGNGRVETIQN